MQQRAVKLLTTIAAVALLASVAACSTDSQSSGQVDDESGGGTSSAATATATAVPVANADNPVIAAIEGAQHSVDITIYELNGPTINQKLIDARQRGVDVRIISNGQWWQEGSDSLATTEAIASGGCEKIFKGDPRAICLAMNQINQGGGNGSFTAYWSNEDFSITHQKTVIVDAMDGNGDALPASELPDSAQAVVMTGNLSAYGYNDPRSTYGCTATNTTCDEWSARDFYLTVTDKELVAFIGKVNQDDRGCDPDRNDTHGIKDDPSPLTWSNGSTFDGVYPQNGNYPYFADSEKTKGTTPGTNVDPGPGDDQGNVRIRQLELINDADDSLLVYNEEMKDDQIVAALAQKAKEIGPGKVRLIMTDKPSDKRQTENLVTLLDAGVEMRLFTSEMLYIHAKAIVADGEHAYVGSTNISSQSMNYNRELGIMLDDATAIGVVTKTFDEDWNTSGAIDKPSDDPSKAPEAEDTSRQSAGELAESSGYDAKPPMPCGAMKLAPIASGTTVAPGTTSAPGTTTP